MKFDQDMRLVIGVASVINADTRSRWKIAKNGVVAGANDLIFESSRPSVNNGRNRLGVVWNVHAKIAVLMVGEKFKTQFAHRIVCFELVFDRRHGGWIYELDVCALLFCRSKTR